MRGPRFDLAILDVNLKGESVWPVADARCANCGIPFVLASGGHVDPPPPEFAAVPMIDKPYTIDRVTPAIDAGHVRRNRLLNQLLCSPLVPVEQMGYESVNQIGMTSIG